MATDPAQTLQATPEARLVTTFAFPGAPVVQGEPNEYLPQAAPIILRSPLDGVMRPVSYATSTSTNSQQLVDLDKMMEEERGVWS
jgi:hypothetical protein